MKIGFIGPGKVGVNLGRYLTYKGIKLSGFYGRNSTNTKLASEITNSKFYDSIQEIIKDSDILFITTPDDNISIIDREISQYDLKSKIICHTSGSLKSTALSNAKLSGADIYSIHPIYAFSNKNIKLEELAKINFSIESNDINKNSQIISLMKILGNNYFIRNINDSATYHLANVFVSNLVLSLLEVGTSYFKTIGLDEKDILTAIYPLVHDNINCIIKNGFVNSLTGPVARGDINTIKNHLSALKDKDKELYKILSLNLLKLVAQKKYKSVKLDECNKNSLENSKVGENALIKLLESSDSYSEIYKILGGLE